MNTDAFEFDPSDPLYDARVLRLMSEIDALEAAYASENALAYEDREDRERARAEEGGEEPHDEYQEVRRAALDHMGRP